MPRPSIPLSMLWVSLCAAGGASCSHEDAKVYALACSPLHAELYSIDVVSGEMTRVGTFEENGSQLSCDIKDIAVDAYGRMFAVGNGLFLCDANARPSPTCTVFTEARPSSWEYGYSGMAVAPRGLIDPGHDVLIASGYGGRAVILDAEGSVATVTNFRGPCASTSTPSAQSFEYEDFAVLGTTIYAAARPSAGGDHLVIVDPQCGAVAQDIGLIGAAHVMGLSAVGGELVGFASDGTVLKIDPSTGAGTPLKTTPALPTGAAWTGAQ